MSRTRLSLAVLIPPLAAALGVTLIGQYVWSFVGDLVGGVGLTLILTFLAFTVPSCVLAVIMVGRRRDDGQCRCRNCRYILRGISEPRCPECGERI